jgi:cyclopropane fatty-acyl-phospholipid synthase-like methyltransferase
MKDPNEVIFTRKTLEAAMATNCSYYHGMSVPERFRMETSVLLEALDEQLKNSERVVDFGMGVGRVTKAILENYPHVQVRGVDNSVNMLEHARKYIPAGYFAQGRVELYTTEQLGQISTGSIDTVIAVYVLQHVASELLPAMFNEFDRMLADNGKLYVLNCKRRAVPDMSRMGLYKHLRQLFSFLERHCHHKQVQRLSIKLDNKCLFHDDGVVMPDELDQRFEALDDIPLNTYPHIDRLMKNHFSKFYGKNGHKC